MATLLQLCDTNQLVRINPVLSPSALEERFIYLLPRAKEWFEKVLPEELPNWNREETPLYQMDGLLEMFCSGKSLAIDHSFKHLFFRDAEGIWELKTADIRIFGWFPEKDRFIASACGLADHVKEHNLYHGFCTQAKRDRDLLDLDPPKFIPGGDPNDVVSNWHTP
jgi:hypothetical protein